MNDRVALGLGIGLVALQVLLSAWAWDRIPDDALVAMRFGFDGTAGGWAPKPVALCFMPVFSLFTGAVLAWAPIGLSGGLGVGHAPGVYRLIGIASPVLFASCHVAIVLHALVQPFNPAAVLLPLFGFFFILLGNFLGKVRRNLLFGFRTPWTLAREQSWNRTHRLAGWLTVALGLVCTALSLVGAFESAGWSLIGGIAVSTAVLFGYSYFAWRSDPERDAV